ncbi:right-handed parallel beta-helix repeat-containing protein [Microbacter margulisiae]|uniref:Uncharacterized protein n=1 Tax=Microbacter margulisiae TaxID=1350067 RepID=A0A7W5DTG5_9PORP|nr:right-handed parallel beta-helix repeat-containing protein [Microbacter margulisiae]MBB3188767.1 hypothetical protein [Microbacter margulisiae]
MQILPFFYTSCRRIAWVILLFFVIGGNSMLADTWDGTRNTSWSYSGSTLYINSSQDLAQMAYLVNHGTTTFAGQTIILNVDIDLNGSNYVWTPIGTSSNHSFYGVFNGQNHIISNVTVNSSSNDIGFFGYVTFTYWPTPTAAIQNLIITNATITGNAYVGGLVGYISGQVPITNCSVSGNVTASTESNNAYVGGLVGYYSLNNSVTMSGCSSSASVTSTNNNDYTGGLIGYVTSGSFTMTNCSATGAISGGDYTGGLIGRLSGQATISNCYATGNIGTSANNYIGGFLGYWDGGGSISSSYAAGNISGSNNYIGGFIGYEPTNNGSNISNCYAMGSVSGNQYAGGFCGYANGLTNTFCYATGSVIGSSNVGGFVGKTQNWVTNTSCYATGSVIGSSNANGYVGSCAGGTFSNCYFDTQGTGQTSGGYGSITGETTSQISSLSISGYTNVSGYYPQLTVFYNNANAVINGWSSLSAVPLNLNSTDNSNSVNYNFTAPLTSSGTASSTLTWGNQSPSGMLSFSNGSTAENVKLLNTGTVTFTATDANGYVKTFYVNINSIPTPSFWYKADFGTSTTTNGTGITQWNDQSGANNNATVLTTGTGTITYADNTINFNPSLAFTNVSRQMLTNSSASVKSFVVVTLPNISSSTTQHLGGLIGATTDNGIRVGATTSPYNWNGDVNGNDWVYGSNGTSWINGTSGTSSFTGWHIVTQTSSSSLNLQYYLGGYYFSPRPYWGNIAEVMAFAGSVTHQNSVETYLAIKYGITLGHDYIAGDGSTNVYAISGYANNIAGLGDDNTYGLNQKVSASNNLPSSTSSRIVMATTNDFTSSNLSGSRTSLTNGQYLIWGDNGNAISSSTWTTSGPYQIVNRTWKVQNTGNVGAVYFQIDLSGYPSSGAYAILVDNNTNFSSGGTEYPLTHISGTLYSTTIPFPSGTSYFTITGTVFHGAIYVRKGGYGRQDGSSWSNAMATVQKAVETSNSMVTKLPVYVAAGDYYQDPNYTTGDYAKYSNGNWNGWANTFVMRQGVNVYGAFPEFGNANNTNESGVAADTTMREPLSTHALYETILHAGPQGATTTDYRVLGPVYSITPIGGGGGFTTPTKWDGFDLTGANIPDNAGGGDDVCGAGAFTVANSTLSNCMVENNTVGSSSNDGAAVEMNGGTVLGCIIHNNNGTGNSSAGTINIRSGGSNVINCLIYNNHMYMAGGSMSINLYTSTSTPCYIINNTMSQNTVSTSSNGAEIHVFGGSGVCYFYNNAVWNGTASYTCVSGVTQANEQDNAWSNGYSGTLGTGSFVLNSSNTGTIAPYFVNPTTSAAADYRLQSSSSALWNKGSYSVSSLVPTTDIRGVFRDAIPDIGCYELASRLYYVNNATGTDAAGYGLNWSNPYKTLSYAISQYSQYDYPQIWVAAGNANYTPASGSSFLLNKNMSIYGGFAGNQATEYPTTLSMISTILNHRNLKVHQTTLAGNSSATVVGPASNYASVGSIAALLDGFTITGATTGNFAVVTPTDTVKVENCKIINNSGGGLSLGSTSKAINLLVADNSGVGINFAGASAKVVNATITNNTGAAIACSDGSNTVANSIVWNNYNNFSGSTAPAVTYSAGSSNYGSMTWSSGTGDIDLLQRSPNFKNPKNNNILNRNYELLLISPCLGNGSVAANPLTIDANGNPRTYNSTIDMGAFEKWDGVTVNGSTLSDIRTGTSYTPATLAAAAKDSLEICVTPGTNFAMGNASIDTHWLELMQDTVSTHLAAQLSIGTLTADSVLYVRRFSKTLPGADGSLGIWTFLGLPLTTASLSSLDGAVDENTVRIEGYSENARAVNGVGYAWASARLTADSTMRAGKGYALSFNQKVPQNDIGQTVIFPSPSQVTFNETASPVTQNMTLAETPSGTPSPLWYNCGWNLIANPLPQSSVISTMWNSSSSSYYGAVYVYKPYTDSYNVVPASDIIAATANSTIAPGQAFFVQTDVNGATTAFQSTSASNPVLQSVAYSRPAMAAAATTTTKPATFQFHITGGGDYSNTYVIFDSRAHTAMEPMEDNPTMGGISGDPALQLSTTATGSSMPLAINRLPFSGSSMTVPLQLYAPKAGSYTITMPQSDTIAKTVLLEDSLGNMHNLSTGGYTFSTAQDGLSLNYILVFGSTALSATKADKGVSVIQDHRQVWVTSVSSMQQVMLVGENGQICYSSNPMATQVSLQLPQTPALYLLKIVTAQGVVTKKLVSW